LALLTLFTLKCSVCWPQSQTPGKIETPQGVFYLFRESEVKKIGLALVDREALQQSGALKDTLIALKDENIKLQAATIKAKDQNIADGIRIAELEREGRIRAETYAAKLEAQIERDRKMITRTKFRKVVDAGKDVGLLLIGVFVGRQIK
jgi:hypothetical protein